MSWKKLILCIGILILAVAFVIGFFGGIVYYIR